MLLFPSIHKFCSTLNKLMKYEIPQHSYKRGIHYLFQNFYYKSVGKAAVKGIVDYFLKIAGLAKAVQSSGQTNM